MAEHLAALATTAATAAPLPAVGDGGTPTDTPGASPLSSRTRSSGKRPRSGSLYSVTEEEVDDDEEEESGMGSSDEEEEDDPVSEGYHLKKVMVELTSAKRGVKNLKKQVKKQKKDLEKAKNDYGSLVAEYNELVDETENKYDQADVDKLLAEEQRKFKDSRISKTECNKLIGDAKRPLNSTISSLKSENTVLKSEKSALKKKAEGLEKDLKKLQDESTKKNERISDLQTKLQKAESDEAEKKRDHDKYMAELRYKDAEQKREHDLAIAQARNDTALEVQNSKSDAAKEKVSMQRDKMTTNANEKAQRFKSAADRSDRIRQEHLATGGGGSSGVDTASGSFYTNSAAGKAGGRRRPHHSNGSTAPRGNRDIQEGALNVFLDDGLGAEQMRAKRLQALGNP